VRHGAKYVVDPNGKVAKVTDDEATDETEPSGKFRQWEAPTAGTAYELQGPDAQAVTMAPAPPLLGKDGQPNPELVFEMAEVYELALLRDKPLNTFERDGVTSEVQGSIDRLNALPYARNPDGRPRKRELVVKKDKGGKVVSSELRLTAQTVFRGSSPGVDVGPYLSQFMLIGNPERGVGSVADGRIAYGVLQIDQRVPIAQERDYMQCMADYVAVQRGLARDPEEYLKVEEDGREKLKRRFIRTPRDLATYVHYDALYEAYLNACLILLEMKAPTDPAFDHLSGGGFGSDKGASRRGAGGFALYGGPHVLTLVTEVATRALKAVRFQKFNNHIRLRPEALAARVELARRFEGGSEHVPEALLAHMTKFCAAANKSGTLDKIAEKNARAPCVDSDPEEVGGYFLPMAFPEGSPMHPAYGAGHATVAGACVTILKAYFDTSSVLVKYTENGREKVAFKRRAATDTPVLYRVDDDHHDKLKEFTDCEPLTLEGELNKLAANISIGRNMAGVHYFSDYYDSLRMGEEIALGILEEQALTYATDPFVLSVPTFDGEMRRIGPR
jgi:hypothetical protein